MDPEPQDPAPVAGADDAEILKRFEEEIGRQEDLVYGIALFFEGVSFLYAGQESTLLTYRKQLRNIIRLQRQAIEQAGQLLEEARTDARKIPVLRSFKFQPGQGHPQPEELCRRAQILVQAYRECFPTRSRSDLFTREEIITLLDAAALKVDLLPPTSTHG